MTVKFFAAAAVAAFALLGGSLVGTSDACAAHALIFPALAGRVVDDAGILDPATKAALDRKLAEFETKTTGQLVVVTVKSLQGTSIEDYGYQLGRHWGIGQKEKNTGALLIVAPNERKVRVEVGYGLEGTLTDAASRLIIENSIRPRFRAKDFAGGVNRGVDDIIRAVSVESEEWKSHAKQRPNHQPDLGNVPTLPFLIVLFLIVIIALIRSSIARLQGARPGRRGPIVVDFPGGISSGGFSGGGGFGGGGGSFGGGGASGDW